MIINRKNITFDSWAMNFDDFIQKKDKIHSPFDE